jgi:hypothetical protein
MATGTPCPPSIQRQTRPTQANKCLTCMSANLCFCTATDFPQSIPSQSTVLPRDNVGRGFSPFKQDRSMSIREDLNEWISADPEAATLVGFGATSVSADVPPRTPLKETPEHVAWLRRYRSSARKRQGGRRDLWGECIRNQGIPLGLKVTPDAELSHKTRVGRTRSLKAAEARRAARPAPVITKAKWKAEADASRERAKRELEAYSKLSPAERIARQLRFRTKGLSISGLSNDNAQRTGSTVQDFTTQLDRKSGLYSQTMEYE